jgi:NOL1/NOP2/fmu family ribosome biogenesis protein
MFRKDSTARQDWSEEMIAGCVKRQVSILHSAARLVRPAGYLVYSTCTFAPEEDEGVVSQFLDAHPDYALLDPLRHPTFANGHPAWVGSEREALRQAVRLWPHRLTGEGHFIALFQRSSQAVGLKAVSSSPEARFNRTVQGYFEAFCRQNLQTVLPTGQQLAIVGSRLYLLPNGSPNLVGLRVMHPGWYLGDLKKDRFEPSQALALGLAAHEAQRLKLLSVDDPDLLAYLRCEPLRTGGEDGWTLVTLNLSPHGSENSALLFPLGWGKHVQGVLKNHYPRGLQWQ